MQVATAQEALFMACEMESSAIQLYTRALSLMEQLGRQDEPLYDHLTLMLADEQEHLAQFRALADLLGGYTLYILPTFVIKGLVAAVAVCALRARHPYWLTVALLVLAELVMVAGYFVTEWLLLGYGLAAAAGAVVPNLVQGFSGVVLGAMLIPLLRRVTPPAMRL